MTHSGVQVLPGVLVLVWQAFWKLVGFVLKNKPHFYFSCFQYGNNMFVDNENGNELQVFSFDLWSSCLSLQVLGLQVCTTMPALQWPLTQIHLQAFSSGPKVEGKK